jgi:hydroxyethylthiazole kinase
MIARRNPIAEINERIAGMLSRIRAQKPLIHHLTNLVVMNDVANITLHVGALPVMAYAAEEVAEMTGQAGALALNLGTLTPSRVESMLIAGRQANKMGIPVILDPVGAGATTLRSEAASRLLNELAIAVVRGNAGEIGTLSGVGGVVKGVESVEGVSDPGLATQVMAREQGSTIATTGKRDFVSDGKRMLGVDNGHELLTRSTGTGCMATAVIAAFAAVEKDYLLAAAGGLACFGVAAELAAGDAHGPASFKVALFDHIYNLTPEQVAGGARVAELAPMPAEA